VRGGEVNAKNLFSERHLMLSGIKMTFTLDTFCTFRKAFHTNEWKNSSNYLVFSKLITTFAIEFQVLLRVEVCYNGSNIIKKSD